MMLYILALACAPFGVLQNNQFFLEYQATLSDDGQSLVA
jgi:hypothetical protein